MLWNLIYEFFVKYIFGGILEVDGIYKSYRASLGVTSVIVSGEFDDFASINTSDVFGYQFAINDGTPDYIFTMSFGNYMSLIATIITMIIILIVIGHFIKKAFNLFGRII